MVHMHPEVYILILPGFGIVSHIVSRFSLKPIFGQIWPREFINSLQHAICRNIIQNYYNTNYIFPKVKIYSKIINPQITNALRLSLSG